jgi:hypothetical protein
LIDLTFLGILLAKDDKEAQKNSKYDWLLVPKI